VAIIDPREDASRALIYSSYVTGTGEQEVRGLEVDASGTIYVTGTVVGNVFEPGQAVPPPDTNSNVYFFAFRPSPPSVTRQGSRKADSPASGESRRR
jgi:hypothetical protein